MSDTELAHKHRHRSPHTTTQTAGRGLHTTSEIKHGHNGSSHSTSSTQHKPTKDPKTEKVKEN